MHLLSVLPELGPELSIQSKEISQHAWIPYLQGVLQESKYTFT